MHPRHSIGRTCVHSRRLSGLLPTEAPPDQVHRRFVAAPDTERERVTRERAGTDGHPIHGVHAAMKPSGGVERKNQPGEGQCVVAGF